MTNTPEVIDLPAPAETSDEALRDHAANRPAIPERPITVPAVLLIDDQDRATLERFAANRPPIALIRKLLDGIQLTDTEDDDLFDWAMSHEHDWPAECAAIVRVLEGGS